jgi:hypothetical protein
VRVCSGYIALTPWKDVMVLGFRSFVSFSWSLSALSLAVFFCYREEKAKGGSCRGQCSQETRNGT